MEHSFAIDQLNLDRALEESFDLQGFRPGQRAVIEAVLGGRDALAVMPTGAGKSLCFQLPAVVHPGLTLVISPLIALMKDQVDSLQRRGVAAAYLASTQSAAERNRVYQSLHAGELDLLYVSPERLNEGSFVGRLAQLDVWLVAVDEAHCISAWGIDFRPDYMRIPEAIERLPKRPVIAAFTATATPSVRDDLVVQLGQHDPHRVQAGFDRPNLRFLVEYAHNQGRRRRMLVDEVRKRPGSGIVYAGTRKASEDQAAILQKSGRSATAYHAGLGSHERHIAQEAFLSGEVDVIVATNAFGMGIDKPDVRFVIHTTLPASPDAYYQEIGRAGRDGEPSDVLLLYLPDDRRFQEWLIDQDLPEVSDLQRLYEAVRRSYGQLDLQAMAGQFGDETKVRVGLQALAEVGLVTLGTRLAGEQLITANVDRIEISHFRQLEQALAKQRNRRLNLLDEMVSYVESDQCRRATLLAYFNDPNAVPSGLPTCCDICGSGAAPSPGEELRLEQARKLAKPKRLSRRRAVILEAFRETGSVREVGLRLDMPWKKANDQGRKLITDGHLKIEEVVPADVLEQLGQARQRMDEAKIDYLRARPGYLQSAMRFCPPGTQWDHLIFYMAHLRREDKLKEFTADELAKAATSPAPQAEKKYRSPIRKMSETVIASLELHQAGLTVDEIAEERGLNPKTIEHHLAAAVGYGRIPLATFVEEDTKKILLQAIESTPKSETFLRDIRATANAMVGQEYPYFKILCVLATVEVGGENDAELPPSRSNPRIGRLYARKQKAERMRDERQREGRPWPASWEAEYQRIVEEIAELKQAARRHIPE